jgi:hypothetical protein
MDIWSFLGTDRITNLTAIQWGAKICSLYEKMLAENLLLVFKDGIYV